ncbi:MAG: cell division protein FtsL [Pseudomonadales bacterium]|nr:cell division protein FtsL [Pseudomonadales bacterium]
MTTEAAPLQAVQRERNPGRGYWLGFCALLLLAMASALAVIYATHLGRGRLNVLQLLEQQRNAVQAEYGRLLLEQSSLVSQGKIENMAVSELGMQRPDMSKVVVLGN